MHVTTYGEPFPNSFIELKPAMNLIYNWTCHVCILEVFTGISSYE